MANEYKISGVDLRSIFAVYAGGNPYPLVGYTIGGTDVAFIYRKSEGGDQINYNTNYRSAGTDFRYIFRSSGYTPPTSTPTPTPSATATPTPTPTSPGDPTATPTPTPTATPTVTCTEMALYYDGSGQLTATWTACDGTPMSVNVTSAPGDEGSLWGLICIQDGSLFVSNGSDGVNGPCP